jgi:hypothetical protein
MTATDPRTRAVSDLVVLEEATARTKRVVSALAQPLVLHGRRGNCHRGG